MGKVTVHYYKIEDYKVEEHKMNFCSIIEECGLGPNTFLEWCKYSKPHREGNIWGIGMYFVIEFFRDFLKRKGISMRYDAEFIIVEIHELSVAMCG